MRKTERVTLTLPVELLRGIDKVGENRSKFIADAVRRELDRRRHRRQREALHESLAAPHPDTARLADGDLGEWASTLPTEDAEGLLDMSKGRPVRWIPGEGWVEMTSLKPTP